MPGARRRSTSALVPLAALALLAAGFLVARPDRVPEAAPTGTQQPVPPVRSAPPPRSPTRPPTALGSPERAAASTAARHFLAHYLQLLRGSGSVRALPHSTPELRRDLRRRRPRPTPAQQAHPAAIRDLHIAPHGPGSARAIAILHDAGAPPYRLLLYLEARGPGWLVTRIGDA
jgi:hypothetical protein